MLKVNQAPHANQAPPAPWDDIPPNVWEDWRWQIANRITTVDELSQIINLTEVESIMGRIRTDSQNEKP